jgi:hypothetical protein
VSSAIAARGDEEPDGFQSPFSTDVVNALSAGYQSGVEVARERPWVHALDVVYGLNVAPYGLVAAEHGIEAGYRYGLGRFFAGLRGAFHTAGFGGVYLRRAGAFLDGGLRFRPAMLEVEPHVGAGITAVWRDSSTGPTRADLTAPFLTAGIRIEVPISMGFSVSVDARGEVTFVALDGVRTPFVSPLIALGLTWKS